MCLVRVCAHEYSCQRSLESSGAGVTGGCDQFNKSARKWPWVLSQSRACWAFYPDPNMSVSFVEGWIYMSCMSKTRIDACCGLLTLKAVHLSSAIRSFCFLGRHVGVLSHSVNCFFALDLTHTTRLFLLLSPVSQGSIKTCFIKNNTGRICSFVFLIV